MKVHALLLCTVAALATVVAASPAANPADGPAVAITARDAEVRNLLEKRKNCSGKREAGETCTGKKLQKQNSFHNCENSGGKCCAAEANGDKGINVSNGIGREDCGYCFSGKCKA